ncbi:unnamed protein product [Adineta ricciae]|uniref:Uncharacterized protein n=1 Tax=Adineta ricciae TaxID=249248 RepID=A0A813PFI3_ADIRI|nr:unnamed protein product [Adineta ricciae]
MIISNSISFFVRMCRERKIDDVQVDNTATEQVSQILEQLHDELFELIATTAHLQEEIQIEARLSKDKCHHRRQKRRYSLPIKNKRLNFRQLKQKLQRQRQSFLRFERRLRAKYEQPFYDIVSNSTKSQQRRCRRIRSIPSESID